MRRIKKLSEVLREAGLNPMIVMDTAVFGISTPKCFVRVQATVKPNNWIVFNAVCEDIDFSDLTKEQKFKLMEYFSRMNTILLLGGFVFDPDDGSTRYKLTMPLDSTSCCVEHAVKVLGKMFSDTRQAIDKLIAVDEYYAKDAMLESIGGSPSSMLELLKMLEFLKDLSEHFKKDDDQQDDFTFFDVDED